MIAHRRHDYDDGFDEEMLHDDELYFEAMKKRPRPKAASQVRKSDQERYDRYADEVRPRRKVTRLKAWGTP